MNWRVEKEAGGKEKVKQMFNLHTSLKSNPRHGPITNELHIRRLCMGLERQPWPRIHRSIITSRIRCCTVIWCELISYRQHPWFRDLVPPDSEAVWVAEIAGRRDRCGV